MTETVTLKIDGHAFEGWEEISIRRSLNCLSSSFQLALSDVLPGRVERAVIGDQSACEIWLGSDLVITGRIFDIERSTTDRSRSLSVSGRDITADIIDCAAVHRSGQWTNQTLGAIAAELLKPFGLTVKLQAPAGAPFAKFVLEQGEKVFDAITRMCRMRGVMLKSSRAGEVVVFKPSTAASGKVLAIGRNLKSLSSRSSTEQRFSLYIVKGQAGGRQTEGKAATAAKGVANDPGITRYRPIVIISDEQATPAGLTARAQWEATARFGEAQTLTGICAGWRWDDGQLFEPDTIVRVISDVDGIDDDFMIADVDFDLKSGSETRLALVRPEAWTSEALLEAKTKKKKKSGLNWAEAYSE